MDAIDDASLPDGTVDGILSRFPDEARKRWATLNAASTDKAVEFLFAGFSYTEDADSNIVPSHFVATITNFKDHGRDSDNTFRLDVPDVHPGYLILGGFEQAVPDESTDELEESLRRGDQPRAVVAKAVHLIQSTAKSSASKGLVGGQCTTLILPVDPMMEPEMEYHTERTSDTIYGINIVDTRRNEPEGFFPHKIMGLSVSGGPDAEGRQAPIAVPRVGRNDRCPCGSGKKYKRCHGR